MFDACILLVGVLLSIFEGRVFCHPCRDGFSNQGFHPISILPWDVSEVVVENTDDIRKQIQFRFGMSPSGTGRNRFNFSILIRQNDFLDRLFFDTVAVHINGIQDSLGEVFLNR